VRGVQKAELNGNIDSENNHGGSSMDIMDYIGAGCSQKDDKLLRQGCERAGPPRGQDWGNATRTGWLEKDSSTTMDSSHGGNDFHRLEAEKQTVKCANLNSRVSSTWIEIAAIAHQSQEVADALFIVPVEQSSGVSC
jgi:hypothetical protein